MSRISVLTALAVIMTAPAFAGQVIYASTTTPSENNVQMITPITTIRAVEHQPPITTVTTSTDGNTLSETTSSASTSYYEENQMRAYHGRPIVTGNGYVPVTDTPGTTYSSTTVTHIGQDEIPGVMSLQDEANIAVNASADFN